jgi:VCBS repeat-containing protein
MKKIFILLVFIATNAINAKAPQGFNYQAIVRNNSGQLLLNQNVLVKFKILQNSATETIVYSENQTANTDDFGQINLVVGQGTAPTGTFSTINWGSGSYYLGIELNAGTGYVAMGTTQLLSVPYPLYADSAGSSQAATPTLASVLAVNNGANNFQIKNLSNPTDAQDVVTKSYSDLQLHTQISNLQQQITNSLIAHYPAGSVFCTTGPTQIVPVLNPRTGKVCMNRNLGASRAATSTADSQAYGDLYQWGRRTDGYQCRNSATTNVLSSTNQPDHGNFILTPNSPHGVTFSGGNSNYCNGSFSRNFLIDTYGWIISDARANSSPIALADSITVLQGGTTYLLDNDKIRIVNASVTSYTTASGETITTLVGGGSSVLTNDTDAENNSLKAILVTKPINGAFALNSDGKFVYIHNGSKTTKDSFTYKANDGTSDSNTVTVFINIKPVNLAPIALADSITVLQGGTETTLVGGPTSVLANDTDSDKNILTATLVTNPVNGLLTLNSNGTFKYVHNGSETTTDNFTYKANDGSTNSNTVIVSISIIPFSLSYNNFSIETKSETCSGKNNGEIIINATQSLNYTATINNINYNFLNNSLTVSNLTPGVYNACIGVSGLVFKQCYTLTIAKGGSITGKLSNMSSNKVAVEIKEGTAPFEILVNGKSQFETNQTSFSVNVNQGDLIEVKTAIACEGIYSKAIMDAPIGISAYPNPTSGEFEIQVPGVKDEIYIELFSINSILISNGMYPVVNQKVKLSIENQSIGIYIAKVHSGTPISLIIIKE